MKGYYDLYLKCDVLLLDDALEKFRNGFLENYGLFHSHCLSALALSWVAMFNMTKVQLDLISDVEMYLFPENSMGEGVFIFLRDTANQASSI